MLNFEEIVSTFELLVNFNRYFTQNQSGSSSESPIEIESLLNIVNDHHLRDHIKNNELTTYSLTCLYWIFSEVSSKWDKDMLTQMEQQLIANLNEELQM